MPTDLRTTDQRPRIRPSIRPPAAADAHDDVSDELASLFLGEHDAATHDHHEDDGAPDDADAAIELLVLGNLPVFAGAWASQYARERSVASNRPIALLSLDDDEGRLDLFGLDADASNEPLRSHAALPDALRDARRRGASLVVRLPASEASWLAAERASASVTVLTGADDPAIVGAYRTLKAISQDLESGDGPAMRTVIAGSEDADAGRAGEKLRAAAMRFLGLEVEVGAPLQRIDAGRSAELYCGPKPEWADVLDVIEAFREIPEITRPPVPPANTEAADHDTPEPAAVVAEECESMNGRARPIRTGDAASLAAALDLEAIDIDCPYARSVVLAVDARGTIHAVGRADDAEDAASAIRDLVIASSWLRDHTELVACAIGRPLQPKPCERHVVLRDARGALALAQGELRVHAAIFRDATCVGVCALN
ncbi:MAG: hypothetical protein AAFX79_05230 [Planctomycetota bacterium]